MSLIPSSCHLLVILLALLFLTRPALGFMSFRLRNKVTTAHTYDFFQVKYDYYDRPNGVIAFMNPSDVATNQCLFRGAAPNATAVAQGGIRNETGGFYEHTVILLNVAAGAVVGCKTITQMALAAVKYGDTLEAAGYPPASTLILASSYEGPGHPGGPLSEAYPSYNPRIGDGPPDIPTAFIRLEDALQLIGLVQRYIPVEVSQERGPWNDAFLDQGYVVYNWIIFSLNVFLCLYGLYRFTSLMLYGYIKVDLRTSIFLLGLISTIIGAITFPMRVMTLKYRILIQVSSTMHNIAFYLLLLLWSGVLSRVQTTGSLAPFRVMTYGAIASAVTMFILGMVRYLSNGLLWPIKAYKVMIYLIPAIEGLAALLFLAYSVRFAVRMNEYTVTRDVRRALSRLTKLSVIGFISFVILAVTNILSNNQGSQGSVSTTIALYITQNIAMTLRSIGVIYVLNVALPGDTSSGHSSGASSGKKDGSSAWMTLSQGWRRVFPRSHSHTSSSTYGVGSNRPDQYNSSFTNGEASYDSSKEKKGGAWNHGSSSMDSMEKHHLTQV